MTGDTAWATESIQAGDVLDVNGQRMVLTGQFNCATTAAKLDLTGGSMLIAQRVNLQGSGNNDILTDSDTVIWNTGGDGLSVQASGVDNSGVLQGVFVTQASGHTVAGYDLVCSKLIVMGGLNTDDA